MSFASIHPMRPAINRNGLMNGVRRLPAVFGALLVLVFALLFSPAALAQSCPAVCNLGTTINDYWPGTGNPGAGATSIVVGTQRTGPGTAGNPIAAGDFVILIQMQDATYNSANTQTYGVGAGTSGAGYTAARQSGLYEFAKVLSVAGSTINLRDGLVNSYNTTLSGNQTTPRYQVVRIPNCISTVLPAGGTIAGPPWNGTTGGVVALRGETVNGNGATINAAGIGFRGGATDAHNAPANTNSYASVNTADQYKGEGFAATPDYVYDATVNTEISTTVAPPMPGGYRGRGAPANAGGGGEGDSGAGGGGNGGAGGRGGTWSPTVGADPAGAGGNGGGGRGGAVFSERAYNRLVMGGGGGGGSANQNATTVAETVIPQGTGTRQFNRGGLGGGIVILGAVSRVGALTVNANGLASTGSPYASENVGSRVGGGGGAGGSIVIFGAATGGATVAASAIGGKGYDDSLASDANHVAHGGGGGGGVVRYPVNTGITPVVTAGAAGCVGATQQDENAGANCNNTNVFTSTSGTAGDAAAFGALTEPGSPSCGPANIGVTKSNLVSAVVAGQTTTYSISVVNSGPSAAPGTVVTDPAVSGLNCSTMTFSATPAGGATVGALSISALQSSGIAITPTFNANSTATFNLTCGVTATGQ